MNLLTINPLTTAVTSLLSGTLQFNAKLLALSLQANFTYGSGGTTFDAYIQSSIDKGATWFDVAQFHFTTASGIRQYNLSGQTPITAIRTPTSGSLSANTSLDGVWGDRFRVLYTSTGTYGGGTTVSIDATGDLT